VLTWGRVWRWQTAGGLKPLQEWCSFALWLFCHSLDSTGWSYMNYFST
jgi:hypothetical protein